jgi:hypothetical protein
MVMPSREGWQGMGWLIGFVGEEEHDNTMNTILGPIFENAIFLEWLGIVFVVSSCSCFWG